MNHKSGLPVILLMLSILIIGSAASVSADQELEIVIIDVGQGDCALIVAPDGRTVLIDGGETGQVSKVFEALNARNISTIDVMISTHPHKDHIDGLIDVMEGYRIGKVIDAGGSEEDSLYGIYMNQVRWRGIPYELAKAGTIFEMGPVKFSILNPDGIEAEDVESLSVVLLVEYGNFSVLFTGDIDSYAEERLVRDGVLKKVTLLKVAHHGSVNASTEEFLSAVLPKYAAISVGKDNKYGHPSPYILNRLGIVGATVLRTDVHGTITFTSNGSATTVAMEKNDFQTMQRQAIIEYLYVASKNSPKFHYSTCDDVLSIKPANLIKFDSREQAVSSGRKPCDNCKP